MMGKFPLDYSVPILVTVVAQLILFMRWLLRRIRYDEIMRIFVRDMAVNHLPHIYHALRWLCQKQGIELPDPPPIRWVDLNGRNGS